MLDEHDSTKALVGILDDLRLSQDASDFEIERTALRLDPEAAANTKAAIRMIIRAANGTVAAP